jgi:hypothetical protein
MRITPMANRCGCLATKRQPVPANGKPLRLPSDQTVCIPSSLSSSSSVNSRLMVWKPALMPFAISRAVIHRLAPSSSYAWHVAGKAMQVYH